MKLKISAVLLKEEVRIADAISNKPDIRSVRFQIDEHTAHLFWRKSQSQPKWIDLFEAVDGINVADFKSENPQAVLALLVEERVICFTFGHARHLIESIKIEKYFGLKVALNISDPELLKSIDKSSIDKVPFQSRSQSSRYVSINEFEFKFDWEILKSITGVVESDNDDDTYEVVSGSDTVSLFTEVQLAQFPSIAERLMGAYTSDRYKEIYPWIDYIVPVRDHSIVSQLDSALVEKINQAQLDAIWIAAPKVIDYSNFSGYCYHRRHRLRSSVVTHPDLDLAQCLREKGYDDQEVGLPFLKATKIFLYDSNQVEIEDWNLYDCLNAELQLSGKNYLLSEGCWYSIDSDFSAQIEAYFRSVPVSHINLPGFRGLNEREYLEQVADGNNLFLLDRKLVKPHGAGSSIEFCDLMTRDGGFIHVKRYSSSSVLSHLFSQAYVSAECLLNDESLVAQVNNHLEPMTDYRFEFDRGRLPRRNRVILAIMDSRQGDLELPFFSKINLKQYVQRLVSMGFRVELRKISY